MGQQEEAGSACLPLPPPFFSPSFQQQQQRGAGNNKLKIHTPRAIIKNEENSDKQENDLHMRFLSLSCFLSLFSDHTPPVRVVLDSIDTGRD